MKTLAEELHQLFDQLCSQWKVRCRFEMIFTLNTIIKAIERYEANNESVVEIEIEIREDCFILLKDLILNNKDKLLLHTLLKTLRRLFVIAPSQFPHLLKDLRSKPCCWDVVLSLLAVIRKKIKPYNDNEIPKNLLSFEESLNDILELCINKMKMLAQMLAQTLAQTLAQNQASQVTKDGNFFNWFMAMEKSQFLVLLDMFKCITSLMKLFRNCYEYISVQNLTKYKTLLYYLKHFMEKTCSFLSYQDRDKNSLFTTNNPIHLLWSYYIDALLALARCFVKVKTTYEKQIEINIQEIYKELHCYCMKICDTLLDPIVLNNISIVKMSFIGQELDETEQHTMFTLNECTLHKLILFTFYMAYNACDASCQNKAKLELHLASSLSLVYKSPTVDKQTDQMKALLQVMMEQDDLLIESLLVLLKIFLKISTVTEDINIHKPLINPFQLFFTLLESLTFDDSILLDWLVSTESLFTDYLSLYIEFCIDNFHSFIHTFGSIVSEKAHDEFSAIANQNLMDIEPFFSKLQVDTEEIDKDGNISLVAYSSSEHEEDGDVVKSYPENVVNIMSCLIRLNLKLDRLHEQELLSQEVLNVHVQLNRLEELYEE